MSEQKTFRYCEHITSIGKNSNCNECQRIWCNQGCGRFVNYTIEGYAQWVCRACYNKHSKGVQSLERCFMQSTDKAIKESIEETLREGCNPPKGHDDV